MSKKDVSLLKREGGFDNFEIPHDIIKLPSKGLIYPENHPLCGVEDVEFKAMGPIQESILASKALIKKGTVLPVLVKSSLVNQSIDPSTLILGDRVAILLAIRISGFGPEYKNVTKCPNCNEEFDYTFNLSKVELKFLETEPCSPNKNLFEYILPESKVSIKFKLLTDADELEIIETQQRKRKALMKHGVTGDMLDIDTRIVDELKTSIVSIDGNDNREYISRYIDSGRLKTMDSRSLRKYINEIAPGVEMEQEVKCSFCGEADDHKILLGTQFFWPSLES